jgi:hypothetical protein
MMNILAQIITWLNIPVNILGKILLFPTAYIPGWLSNTIVSAVAGVILLVLFKYTSNQTAIGRVRDHIKADMIALKLFKDSFTVIVQAQGRVFKGAMLLLFFAIVPMLVMIMPVSLMLGQMGLWYQARPLQPGEETTVIMKLNGTPAEELPLVNIEPMPAADVTTGPVRVPSKREIYWRIKARENGNHRMVFQVGDQEIEKQLVAGSGFMRVSMQRPGWEWMDILLHPEEKPFTPDDPVHSITIQYPDRPSKTSGTNWWLGYFFVASLVFALIFKPFLKVRI